MGEENPLLNLFLGVVLGFTLATILLPPRIIQVPTIVKETQIVEVPTIITETEKIYIPTQIPLKNFPTLEALRTFLEQDDTNEIPYNANFVCLDYALHLAKRAELMGYRIGHAELLFDISYFHAMNTAYIEEDSTLVYIEPQTDKIYTTVHSIVVYKGGKP